MLIIKAIIIDFAINSSIIIAISKVFAIFIYTFFAFFDFSSFESTFLFDNWEFMGYWLSNFAFYSNSSINGLLKMMTYLV